MSGYLDFLDDDENPVPQHEQPDLDTTLKTLKENVDGSANTIIFYGLSGLSSADILLVREAWEQLIPDYRQKLLQQLVDVSEANFELDYRPLALMALEDGDPGVRTAAIELLWEDETLEVMNLFIEMAQWDEAVSVRASAVSALGRFILLGELGDLPEAETMRAQDVAASLFNDQAEEIEVRRRALEAIANCGLDMVADAIEEAFDSDDPPMQASAVFAMGRTYDSRWNAMVLRAIEDPDPAIRYEAARASGELEIEEALPHLARLARGQDREIKEVAIWSLGEIGGSYAMQILGALADKAEADDDEELLDAIDEALGNASLAGRDLDFDFGE